MIDMRPILLVTGVLLATLGCAMMIPALYDLTIGHEDWLIFAASATITLFVGIGLAFANRGRTSNSKSSVPISTKRLSKFCRMSSLVPYFTMA